MTGVQTCALPIWSRSKLVVDGDLREWGELAFDVQSPAEVLGHGVYRGPADASFRFDLRWDEEALYFGIDVRDDSVVSGAGLSAREQDHVAVLVDARPDPERSENMGLFAAIRSGAMAELVNLWVTLDEARSDEVMRLFVGDQAEGIQRAARRTSRGYAVEASIPRSVLDQRRGAVWDLSLSG